MTYFYELLPRNGRKSFYGKALVKVDSKTGERTLYSYNTPIIKMKEDKKMRLYNGEISMTTSTHIISFCGLHKQDFIKLPYHRWKEINSVDF